MVDKMNGILENLAYVIGEENLKKFGEATTSAATAPYAKPLGDDPEKKEPSAEGEEEVDAADEATSPVGDAPRPEGGGDPSFYAPEGTKSDYPYGSPGKT